MTLHPQAVAALAASHGQPSVADPGFGPGELARMRGEQRDAALLEAGEPVDRVEDLDADGVRCRLYVPVDPSGRTLVYLHGGGFALGDLDTHDAQARRLANRTGSAVLAVDYRRPPEHRFPAAPDDVDTVLAWLLGRGSGTVDGWEVDAARIVAVGDSAGANLAMVAALRHPGVLAACVLVYPFLDPSTGSASYGRRDGGLTREEATWFWGQYARGPEDLVDPDLAPHLAERLERMPATLVQIAEHDTLADEDTELARRIAASGVAVSTITYAGMIHGFWRHPDQFDAAEEALAHLAGFLDAHVP